MASANLQAELECSICLNIYTDPVTLRCAHNFCRGCMDCVLDTQEKSGSYSCPECREKFQERPALQKNIKLRNIVENFLSAQSDPKESKVFCTYCVDSPITAVKSCLHCEASLCDKHLTVHSKSPEHILCDPTTAMRNRKCSVHNELFKYYCTEESACICVSCCLIGEHKGHQMESLDEASEKRKKTLKNVLGILTTARKTKEERVRSLQEHSRKVQEQAAGETKRATALFIELRKRLEDLEKRVMREISGQAEKICHSTNDFIGQLEIEKDELSKKMRHIEKLCNTTDPLTVLQESDTGDLCDDEDGDNEDGDNEDGDNEDGDNEDGDNEDGDTEDEDGDTEDGDTEDEDNEDRGRHGKLLHDGGDLDVFQISHTLHTGLSHLTTWVNKGIFIPEPADIVLDVNTASNNLCISGDRKAASWTENSQNHPQSPERFQNRAQVMSKQSFSSGRHYWDVDIRGSHNCRVGLCYPSIDRRGEQSWIGSNNKSWGMGVQSGFFPLFIKHLLNCHGRALVIHDSKEISLPADISGDKIRIYLDYEAGQISFYDLCSPIRHIHTFTATFTEPLHAALWIDYGCIKISGGKRIIRCEESTQRLVTLH